MIISYNEEITKQSFLESGEVLKGLGLNASKGLHLLGELENPAAALDSTALNRLPNGKLILSLFSHPEVPSVSSYDGVNNQWFRKGGTWPATIDTITHLRGQRESTAFEKAKRVMDVGCGNGMAGIYAANQNLDISVLFSDIQPEAVNTALLNTSNIKGFKGGYVVDSGVPENFRADVIIASAVPATPVYEGLKREINPLLEGTSFLEEVLRDSSSALRPGGKLIISHSSCGDIEFDELAEKYGAKADRILYQRDNAYRIEFLNDQKWVDFLAERGGLKRKEGTDWEYWHTVSVKEVSFD